jgi:hypothetical protein
MSKKRDDFSAAQVFLAVLGLVAWAIAGILSTQRAVEVVERSGGLTAAPNNLAAAGVLGFAIGGGLCFLGLGLAGRRGENEASARTPSLTGGAGSE